MMCLVLLGGVWEAYSEVENTYVHHLHTFIPALSRYECNTYVFGTLNLGGAKEK